MTTATEVIQPIRHDRVMELQISINEVNSFTQAGFAGLIDALDKCKNDPEVRAIVLTSGAKGYFSNGLDPQTFLNENPTEVDMAMQRASEASFGFFEFPAPTIAVLEGHAMGFGAVLALFADYTFIADKGARFCFPEVNIGLSFPAFTTIVLQDRVGYRTARDLLWSGRAIKGAEALELGIADEVHPADQVREKALALAKTLSSKSQAAIRGMKQSALVRYRMMVEEVTAFDAVEGKNMLKTADAQEGFTSIIEKRRPVFQ